MKTTLIVNFKLTVMIFTNQSTKGCAPLSRILTCLAVVFIVLFSTGNLLAQQRKTISGTVSSGEDQLPLPGVNVIVKGTNRGTSTDFDGKYSIEASEGEVLVYSYVGFTQQEVPVGSSTVMDVLMIEDFASLDEVVVVGYGTQKKSDLTGSVSVVDAEEAKKVVTYDVGKLLQGQAPGVTVQSSGEPGGFVNIKIRGITSFTNNNPLFVIDGVLVDSPYDFAPGEIESIQVLKDASSAAIYGQRGANGVVIITTKKGKAGQFSVNYKSLLGIQMVPRKLPLTDRIGYQTITSAAELNAGLPIVPGNDPDSEFYIDDVDTDWQDEAYHTGIVENHSVTFSGGSEAMTYNMNLDYFDNTSYINTPQKYDRIAASLNLSGEQGRFRYGSKMNYTQSDKESFSEYLPGTSGVIELLQAIPTMPVYDENRLGGYGGADNATQRAITLNIIGFNNLIDNSEMRNRFLGNVWGEYEILKNLKYKLNISFDRTDWSTRRFNPPSDLGWYYITTNDEAALDLTKGSQTRTVIDNLLTYNFDLDAHKFDVLAGWIQIRDSHKNLINRGVGYEPGEISHLEFADAISGREYESEITSISYISRLNYSFDDRYLLTVNFRQDKSSLFAPENNTGNYFSFSGGWKLHNENFFTLPDVISSLKLRGGYGQLGNNTIGVYDYTATVNPFAGYVFGDILAPGTTAVDIKDPNIKWEDTETINAALELGLWDNRFQFTGEYFVKRSTDLLVNVPLPFSTGAFPADITTNAGDIENRGFEFMASYSNSDHAFKYNISANLGTLTNKVNAIGVNDNPINGAASRTEVGRSIGEIYAYVTDGIFQNQQEIDDHAFQPGAAPGDIRFKDLNEDGLITDEDRTFQGKTIPKFNYGLNFSANYRNWDFSMFWQGSAGHKVYNGTYRNLMVGQYTNHHEDMLDFWTPTNTDTNVPRPVIGDPNGNLRDSDRFIENGDFVKLQAVELGYNLPVDKIDFFNRARVYVSGQNLITISNYKGYDPDFISDGLFSRGYDFGSFPNPVTLALGIELNF